jgi:hypothetical protein
MRTTRHRAPRGALVSCAQSITLFGARTLAEVLADSSSLTSLNVSRNRLGDDGAAALVSSPWRGLQQLDLRECELGRAAATALAGTPGPSCLVRLDLSGNALGPGAGDGLGDLLGKCASLRELLLRGCALGDSGVGGVAGALASHACLRHLDLRDNALGDDGVAGALSAALGGSTSLVHLDLGGNPGVGAAAVGSLARALAGSERSVLSHLDVTGAGLSGDDGVAALQELSRAGALRTLCLLGTALGDGGCAALLVCLRSGGFAGLSELSVSGCELEWAGGLEPLLAALLAGEAPQLVRLVAHFSLAIALIIAVLLVRELSSSLPAAHANTPHPQTHTHASVPTPPHACRRRSSAAPTRRARPMRSRTSWCGCGRRGRGCRCTGTRPTRATMQRARRSTARRRRRDAYLHLTEL